jgi:hypothetical protein
VPDVRTLAAGYGVRVELAALGDWGSARLVAEYDPDGPTIRVNEAVVPHDDRVAIDRAIAHELYHHREAIGEVERIGDRGAREAAADAFAAALIGGLR